MNKLRMDLELDSKGYVAGAQEASRSTKDLKQQTEDFVSDFGSLRKQMAASKKEVQNLAGAYASLSKTEKESEFGKEMAAQLNIAIEKAAEFQDVMGDVQQAIKNASSDTQAWDALKEGMEIGKSATLAYAGAVAKLTGNEEDLTKLVKTLTMVENGFNTAIKIGNAVQKQSAIMTGIRKIQILAAGKAEELQTAATVKGTIAQKAFNAVAKANPYVLLASLAVAAATAIGGYMLATKNSTKAEEESAEMKERLNKINESYKDKVVSTASEQITAYKNLQAQWNSLKTELEKTQFIKQNADEFKKLGAQVKTVDDAEKYLVKNSANVVQGMIARAKAAAKAAMAQQLYSDALAKQMELEELQTQRAKELSEVKEDKKTTTSFTTSTGAVITNTFVETVAQQRAAIYKKYKAQETRLQKDIVTLNNKGNKLIKESAEGLKDVKPLQEEVKKTVDKNNKNPKEVEFKILPVPQLDKDFDKKLKDLVKETNAKAQEAFSKTKVELQTTLNSPQNIQQANNRIENAKQVPVELDFEIPENMSEEIRKQQNSLDALVDALVVAETEKIKFANAGDMAGVDAMTEQIQKLTDEYNNNSEALEKNLEKAKRISEISKGFEQAGAAVGAFGDMFSALGEATDSAGVKAVGIILETLANLALSFSQAMIQAASLGPWAWMSFGIAGVAQLASMISQIKGMVSGGFAEGGVVPGSSFNGDKILARLNSGERVLTAKQNENFEKIANGMDAPIQKEDLGSVQFIIKGTSLIGTINNTLKTNRKQPIGL